MDSLERQDFEMFPGDMAPELVVAPLEAEPVIVPYAEELNSGVDSLEEMGLAGKSIHIKRIMRESLGVVSLPPNKFGLFMDAVQQSDRLVQLKQNFFSIGQPLNGGVQKPTPERRATPSVFGTETVKECRSLDEMIAVAGLKDRGPGKPHTGRRRVHHKRSTEM